MGQKAALQRLGQLVLALEEVGVLDGDRGQLRQLDQDGLVGVGEVALDLVGHLEETQRPPAGAGEGDGQPSLQRRVAGLAGGQGPALGAAGGLPPGHAHGALARRHRLGQRGGLDTLAGGGPTLVLGRDGHGRRRAAPGLAFVLAQKDGGLRVVGADDVTGVGRHRIQDAVDSQRRGEGEGGVRQLPELAGLLHVAFVEPGSQQLPLLLEQLGLLMQLGEHLHLGPHRAWSRSRRLRSRIPAGRRSLPG